MPSTRPHREARRQRLVPRVPGPPGTATTRSTSGCPTRCRGARCGWTSGAASTASASTREWPPLVWEAWDGQDWVECEVSTDETGGLNKAGSIVRARAARPRRVHRGRCARRLAAGPDHRARGGPAGLQLLAGHRRADRVRRRRYRAGRARGHHRERGARVGRRRGGAAVHADRAARCSPPGVPPQLQVSSPEGDEEGWLDWTLVDTFADSGRRRPALPAGQHDRHGHVRAGGPLAGRHDPPVRRGTGRGRPWCGPPGTASAGAPGATWRAGAIRTLKSQHPVRRGRAEPAARQGRYRRGDHRAGQDPRARCCCGPAAAR